MQCSFSDEPITFLIDTQADISILKKSSIYFDSIVDVNNKTNIHGVTDGFVQSLGVLNAQIFIANHFIDQQLHIVPNSFPIQTNGILGKDFLRNNLCIIDYQSMKVIIRSGNKSLYLKLQDDREDDFIEIPARCEIIKEVSFNRKLTEDQVIKPQEIAKGIFVASSIVNKNKPIVRILNVTNDSIKLKKKLNIDSQNISNFNILNYSNSNINRSKRVLEKISINLPKYASSSIVDLCTEFADIFALEDDELSVNNFYKQTLNPKDDIPVYTKKYRLPHSQKAEIDRQCKQMLAKGIIEPSYSPYNSPVILVPKKSINGEKKWRMCIDFRQINKKLQPDKFPLPRIDDILDGLGRAKYFSVLDLYSGFFQILLDENSRDITSFSTDNAAFRYRVLPFGLSVAPNSFARMMSIAFSGLEPSTAFLYMDDVIVIGASENHHNNNLRKVFEICRKFNLKLNPEKCDFLKHEVVFLGHKCSSKGILPDSSKFSTISNYPIPNDKDSVKRFVALCNYYRKFIPLFAELASPLNYLTRKRTDFVWTRECNNSFNKLRDALINPPILQYPDFEKTFILTVDAAKYGIGSVLSQNHEGEDLPIAFASRAFTKGELNKSTIEKELSAIHFAIMHFKPYVYGVKFLVRSDHKPLEYLFSLRDPTSKLSRMRMELSEFDFIVEYLRGPDNVVADALSRIDFKDIKNLLNENDAKIMPIQTRAMFKKFANKNNNNIANNRNTNNNNNIANKNKASDASNKNKNDIIDKSKVTEPKIFEAINSYNERRNLFVRFEIKDENSSYITLKASIMKPNRTILKSFEHKLGLNKTRNNDDGSSRTLKFIIKNVESVISQLLTRLENEVKSADKINIDSSDVLFQLFDLNTIKKVANNLRRMYIVITQPIEYITDLNKQSELIEKFHNSPLEGGHAGINRLYRKLRSFYYWKNMLNDIKKYVGGCHSCRVNKPRQRNVEQLSLVPTPQKPFEVLVIDTMGPLPTAADGSKYILCMICDMTKYLVTVPLKSKDAKTVAKAIFEKFVLVYGIMIDVRTDQGTEFRNKIMTEMLELLGTSHSKSTPYRHETVGAVERNHRILNEYLRAYLTEDNQNWDELLPYYTYCYNTTPSTAMDGYSPFELVYGKSAAPFSSVNTRRVDPIYNIDDYSTEMKTKLQHAHIRVRNYLDKYKIRNKKLFDKKANPIDIKINDLVLITDEARHKLDPLFNGPFIVKNINNCNVTLEDRNKLKEFVIHKNRIRHY